MKLIQEEMAKEMKLTEDEELARIVNDTIATLLKCKYNKKDIYQVLATGTIGTGEFIGLLVNTLLFQLRHPEKTPGTHSQTVEARLCSLERMMDTWRTNCDKNNLEIRKIKDGIYDRITD